MVAVPDSAAALLRRLHAPGDPLLLPNAWDAASARRFADLGARAIATTSGGVARALGFDDGQNTPIDEMLEAVERIAAVVDVPLTADMEAGYDLPAAELAERLLQTGAVGLNLEDSDHARPGTLVAPEAHAERIAVLAHAGLVVNARIDVHLNEVGDPASRLDEALRRAVIYLEAGAACVYPILLDDEVDLGAFVAAAGAPVNALQYSGSPTLARMRELGVARVSVGSGLASAALDHAAGIARAFLAGDDLPLREADGEL